MEPFDQKCPEKLTTFYHILLQTFFAAKVLKAKGVNDDLSKTQINL